MERVTGRGADFVEDVERAADGLSQEIKKVVEEFAGLVGDGAITIDRRNIYNLRIWSLTHNQIGFFIPDDYDQHWGGENHRAIVLSGVLTAVSMLRKKSDRTFDEQALMKEIEGLRV